MSSKYGWRERVDCFAFDGSTGGPICGALKTPLCALEGKCAFYASEAKAVAERKRTHLQAVRAGYYPDGGKYEPKGDQ